jgi:hypothetical protein
MFFDTKGIVNSDFVLTKQSQSSILPSSFGMFMAVHLFKKRPNFWLNKWILHHDVLPFHTPLSVM